MITKHGFISNSSTTSFFLGIKKDKLSTIKKELDEYEDFRQKFDKYFSHIHYESIELCRQFSAKEAQERIDKVSEYYDDSNENIIKMRSSIENNDHVYYGSSVPQDIEDSKDMFLDILNKLDKNDYFVMLDC